MVLSSSDKTGYPASRDPAHTTPEPPGWLVKRVGGAGGVHVRRASTDDKARAGWYFQRELSGRLLSAVFVADGRCAKIVGFSEQWPAQGLDEQPYLYGGAVTVGGFKPALAREIADIVYTLVEQSTLRGVCGIDFMVRAGVPYVLEVNPRPSATFELHEHGTSLVNWHIEACRRRMVQGTLKGGSGACGHAIVYAQGQVQIPSSLTWPLWVSDRPRPGSVIGRATPVCTVHAKAPDPMMARRCLAARVAYLWHTLE
jgi:Predicted ATP-dependent carboligase related to biotin carboxylase